MAKPFFNRLRDYYIKIGAVLRGEADAATIFPNPTDNGMSREKIYFEFLKQHLPSKCNIFFGGYLFDGNGNESKQLDIIITTDTTQRFNFHNKDGSGKSFAHTEGTLGIVSIKSNLNQRELEDALIGIASIPKTTSLEGRVNPLLKIKDYDDWPVKIIYSTDGIACETLCFHLNKFYREHPEIPICRRPNFIHVSGKYCIIRAKPGMNYQNKGHKINLNIGDYYPICSDPDLHGIVWVLNELQVNALASTHILFSYEDLINRLLL